MTPGNPTAATAAAAATALLVVDASALIAIIRGEPAGKVALEHVERHRSAGGEIVAPDLFLLELANVLIRRYRVPVSEVVDAIRAVDDLGITTIRLDRPQLLLTMDLAARHGLSAYDAGYLALAELEQAALLTVDHRLAAAAGTRTVALPGFGGARAGEQPATYGEDPVDWSRFGAYLAELRAAAG